MTSTEVRAWRVLLVDDILELRMLVRWALQETNEFLVVGEAGDGVEAVRKAGELQPDLVLLDLSMPDMDGIEALPLILQSSPRSVVVVLTGFEGESVGQSALERGAIAVIEKGITQAGLIDELKSIMSRVA
jgi:CheY-like chemotaxis protein